ncbi:hypothetical protein SAMN05216298_2225 [Glycomyces sambucus]|uniref:Uncharacterized protein n=1 Tax=Glycomyces sambucus TaxID=380244 RepID=A0A1G9GJ05_9ACTN|nr:hypothetical protein [Glycomyces sambucus]SDL00485.1 hypothetical protein SAMN05216298_2225 [Glycomyces sambucus]
MEPETTIRYSTVSSQDDDHLVKLMKLDDLIAAHEIARTRRWGATWTTVDALLAEVDPASPKFLLPALRNAAGDTQVESLRCHLWYRPRSSTYGRATIIDVELAQFRALPTLSPAKTTTALELLVATFPLTAID